MTGEQDTEAILEPGDSAEVYCIQCSQPVARASQLMGRVGLQGFPVRVVDESGKAFVQSGWAVSPGLVDGMRMVVVHDLEDGKCMSWPSEWVHARDMGE